MRLSRWTREKHWGDVEPVEEWMNGWTALVDYRSTALTRTTRRQCSDYSCAVLKSWRQVVSVVVDGEIWMRWRRRRATVATSDRSFEARVPRCWAGQPWPSGTGANPWRQTDDVSSSRTPTATIIIKTELCYLMLSYNSPASVSRYLPTRFTSDNSFISGCKQFRTNNIETIMICYSYFGVNLPSVNEQCSVYLYSVKSW